jgi:tetratricopeptide (TPR) repeat protein
MKMSEAALVFSDFSNDNEASPLDKVRERIIETSDQLTGRGIRRKKYKRNSIPETEKEKRRLELARQAEYRQVVEEARAEGSRAPSIWSFENLFPDAVWDETCIKRDLYSIKDQDKETLAKAAAKVPKAVRSDIGSLLDNQKRNGPVAVIDSAAVFGFLGQPDLKVSMSFPSAARSAASVTETADVDIDAAVEALGIIAAPMQNASTTVLTNGKVDRGLTRLVEDKLYGYRRTQAGQFQYETSLMGDGAVKFRDGVRLGNPLSVNADRLTYMAKKELQHGRVEEAKELYERAVNMDPRDGRGYLGLSRCAERRQDFKLARDWLRAGIQNSFAKPTSVNTQPDQKGNPFLLQALGRLEEMRGHLSEAESLYVQAARSRPSHAAAWVSLAQLRTGKLGQTIAAGRICYESAERELKKAGLPQNSHVYTAWASLEHKGAGDVRRARQLFQSALKIDPKCSAAWLQLGVMEAENENWETAEQCFEKVMTFDQRNSRVLQAYALLETRRPGGSSRKAIDLFERALKVNPRDAGVLQPYALYVAELGDLNAAREL